MNRFIEIIKYTWKAKGRHGIHSPFVYDLVDICFRIPVSKKIYDRVAKKMDLPRSSVRLLLQLCKHLNYSQIITNITEINELKTSIQQGGFSADVVDMEEMGIQKMETSPTLIFMRCDSVTGSIFEKVSEMTPFLDENTFVILCGIRNNRNSWNEWNRLVSFSSLHFTADMNEQGILSKRSFQEKEHFVLRY